MECWNSGIFWETIKYKHMVIGFITETCTITKRYFLSVYIEQKKGKPQNRRILNPPLSRHCGTTARRITNRREWNELIAIFVKSIKTASESSGK